MKKAIMILSVLTLFTFNMTAQSELGLKLGLSTYDLPDDVLDLEGKDLRISIENANYGVHFGTYLRISLLGLNIQPELNFNSNTVRFKVTDIKEDGWVEEIKTERYQNIDIPVLLMITPSIFRLYAGPVGHYFLHSSSELKTIEGWKEEFKKMTYGYQAGAGIQIAGISLDVRYEGNLNKFGDHITLDGVPFHFSSTPSRFIFSLGIKL